jgi:4-amino-4-deoxy-L-arabinose transferase-like glycosyltransferase
MSRELMGRYGAWLLVALAVAVYLGLALYQYRLPGLYYDEAADVIPAMQLIQGQSITLHRDTGIHLFGRDLPVMIGDYWGVTSTYAVLPLFLIFGVDVLAIRLFPILACALAVVGTYQLGRRLFDRWVGVAMALLLAVSPTFIFWSRVGIYVIAHIVAITLGIMLLYLSWRERPRWWKLLAMAFLAGLGLTTKLLFVWFFIAVPFAYVVLLLYDRLSNRSDPLSGFIRDHLRRHIPARRWQDLIPLGGGFVIGAFPVLYFNLVSRGSYYLLRSNFGETERGVDNFALLQNIRTQLGEMRIFLDGGYFWFQGGVFTNPLATSVVLVSTVGLMALTALPEYRQYQRTLVFLLSYAVAIFILSCFSISILAATHLFILLPLPQMMMAGFVVLGARALARRWIPRGRAAYAPVALAVVLLGGFIAFDLRTDVRYHRALAETGGLTAFSDAIYPLAEYLDDNGFSAPYAIDWGVRTSVVILTEGRVMPREVFEQTLEPGAAFDQAIGAALREDDPVFVSQTEDSAAFPRIERLRELAEANGQDVILDQVFTSRNGVPAYYVFRIYPSEAGALENRPGR